MQWEDALVLCAAVVLGRPAFAGEDCAGKEAVAGEKVQLPAGVTEQTFSPFPVPRLMLEMPGRPISKEEMVHQVREAESRADTSRASPSQDGTGGNTGAGR